MNKTGKRVVGIMFSLLLTVLLCIPAFAAETYTGDNGYGETLLTVEDDGSFTYEYSQEAVGGIAVSLVAKGTIADGVITVDSIINPEFDNMDVTDIWGTDGVGTEIEALVPDSTYVPAETKAQEPETLIAPSGDAGDFDPSVLEPLDSVEAGTYEGNNDYGPATLEVSPNGDFHYTFNNSVFGDILGLEADGSFENGEFVTAHVINPTMGNFDATSDYNITEFGYQIKSIYLGKDWSNASYQAYLESTMDPELAEKIEASRTPTLIVTIIVLILLLAGTFFGIWLKYKKLWKKAESGEAEEAPVKEEIQYTKQQTVIAELYGDQIPVTFSVDDAMTHFQVNYAAMGNELEGDGIIQDGKYILNENCVGFINNMLELAVPKLTGEWTAAEKQKED